MRKKLIAVRPLPFKTTNMPKDAEILAVGKIEGLIHLWALIDEKAPLVEREFVLICEGDYLDPSENFVYVGVIHGATTMLLFEKVESPIKKLEWRPAEWPRDAGKECRMRDSEKGCWHTKKLLAFIVDKPYPWFATTSEPFKFCEVFE